MTLTVDWQRLMGHLAFQVKIAMDAVDVCIRRLVLIQPGSPGHDLWKTTKERTQVYLANGGDDRSQLCEEMVKAANAIAFEIRMKYSEEHVDMMVYMHLKKVLILETTKGELPNPEGIERYMNSSLSLPREYLSQQYMDTVDKVREKCLESLERQLTSSEISELNHTLLWQASEFLQQLHPPPGGPRPHRLLRSAAGGREQFTQVMGHLPDLRHLLGIGVSRESSSSQTGRPEGRGYVLGTGREVVVGVDGISDESDGEEKKDEGEKEKPDWDINDEDLYGHDTEMKQSEGQNRPFTIELSIDELDKVARTTTSVQEVESLQRKLTAMIQKRSDDRVRLQSECSEFEVAAQTAKSQGVIEIVNIMEAEKNERASRLRHLRDEIRQLHRTARAANDRHRFLTRVGLTDLQNSTAFGVLRKTLVDHKEDQPILVNMVGPLVADFLPSDLLVKICRRMGVNVRPRERRQDWVGAILRFS